MHRKYTINQTNDVPRIYNGFSVFLCEEWRPRTNTFHSWDRESSRDRKGDERCRSMTGPRGGRTTKLIATNDRSSFQRESILPGQSANERSTLWSSLISACPHPRIFFLAKSSFSGGNSVTGEHAPPVYSLLRWVLDNNFTNTFIAMELTFLQ